MRRNITKKERKFKEVVRAVLFIIIMLSILMGWAWALTAKAEMSLYMDATLTAVDSRGHTFFTNEDGVRFEFKGSFPHLKLGDKTVLEIVAKYDHAFKGFRIIDVYVTILEGGERRKGASWERTNCTANAP